MTRSEALKSIAELFEEAPDRITPDTPRDAIAAWDSLGVLTLMSHLHREYGIILADGEIQTMTKVNDILAVLEKNGKLAGE
jgi:acyl carrier protein